jgi:hypothetical protein
LFERLGVTLGSLLDVVNLLMQDLPNQSAQAVGDGPKGLLITEPWQQTAEHHLKMAAFGLHRGLRCLGQYAADIFIALG